MTPSARLFVGTCIVLSVLWIVWTIIRYIRYRKELVKTDRQKESFWKESTTYYHSFWYESLTAVMIFLVLFWSSMLVGALL